MKVIRLQCLLMDNNEILLNGKSLGFITEENEKFVMDQEDVTNLIDLKDEVIKVWKEDGDAGEIQMKTPIAWTRVTRKAEKLRDL